MTFTDTAAGSGLRIFVVVWAGQFVSLVGIALTGFALAIWVYQETGSATQLSLVLLASQLPQILFTPSVGSVIGVGPGRGIAFLFMILGGLSIVFTLIAYLYPRLRNLEDELPDYDEIEPSEELAQSMAVAAD